MEAYGKQPPPPRFLSPNTPEATIHPTKLPNAHGLLYTLIRSAVFPARFLFLGASPFCLSRRLVDELALDSMSSSSPGCFVSFCLAQQETLIAEALPEQERCSPTPPYLFPNLLRGRWDGSSLVRVCVQGVGRGE